MLCRRVCPSGLRHNRCTGLGPSVGSLVSLLGFTNLLPGKSTPLGISVATPDRIYIFSGTSNG